MKYPPVHYHDYLHLDKILGAQHRKSEEYGAPAHDEWLFITVHQAYELWFKQILFEFKEIQNIFSLNPIPEHSMGQAQHHLSRVNAILKLILGQIDVLETMTPLDFLEFRDFLYPASGFQSAQFRRLEILMGLQTEKRMKFTESPFYSYLKPDQQKEILQDLSQPSLFELLDQWLARTPFLEKGDYKFWKSYELEVEKMLQDDEDTIQRNPHLGESDRQKGLSSLVGLKKQFELILNQELYEKARQEGHFRLTHRAFMAALLIQLYRDMPLFQVPFQILSSLLDLDEVLTQWRYRHSLMAHRMLGAKIGTGGTSGHQYLKEATEKHKVFTDLFNLTTFLIPKSRRPKLIEP